VDVVRRYLTAVADQDWPAAEGCLADDVVRIGPFGDVYQGRRDYVEFLRRLMPELHGYRMEIDRIVASGDGKVVMAELSETVEMEGRTVHTPETLVFDLDSSGRIGHLSVYIQTT